MSDQLIRDLREDIQSRLPEMVAFLEALVHAESPSVVPESQSGTQALLAGSLRNDGFRVRNDRRPGPEWRPAPGLALRSKARVALPDLDRPHRYGLAAGHARADAGGAGRLAAGGPRGL